MATDYNKKGGESHRSLMLSCCSATVQTAGQTPPAKLNMKKNIASATSFQQISDKNSVSINKIDLKSFLQICRSASTVKYKFRRSFIKITQTQHKWCEKLDPIAD